MLGQDLNAAGYMPFGASDVILYLVVVFVLFYSLFFSSSSFGWGVT